MDSTDTVLGSSDPPVARPRQTSKPGLPFRAVLGLATGLTFLVISAFQMRDIDLYWHILAGEEIASGVPLDSLGAEWSFAPAEPLPWASTQWLAELILYYAHAAGGWTAIAGLRVVTGIAAILILARTTLRGRPAALAGLPYLVALTAITYASQERPQQATLIGAATLGGVLVSGLVVPQLPRWYLLLPGTILWANLHGGWILVPFVLGIIALGRVLDHGVKDPMAWRSAGLSVLALASGALSPAGVAGVTAPFRLRAATSLIQEWQGTRPLHVYGILTVLMLLLACVGWARSQGVAISEVVALLACVLFSWTAWRNVAPGMALAAPLVAHRLTIAFPTVRRSEPRWSVPFGLIAAFALAALSLVSLVGREHLPVDRWPVDLAKQVADLPAGQRILNDYDAAGLVLFFGGDATQVGIDGRADRYGAEYVEAYVGLRTLKGDWETLLDDLDPTSALFEEEMAIVHVLQAERGWKAVARDDGWVLLTPDN